MNTDWGKSIDEIPGKNAGYGGKNRSHLTAWLSEDDGKTWRGGLMLDERATVSYPDGFQAAGPEKHSVVNTRFTLAETDALAKDIASKQEETAKGFVSLFDGKSFEGWEQKGNWTIEDGAFARAPGGGSLTYTSALVPDDFELRFEWNVSKGCNSGVYHRPARYSANRFTDLTALRQST